MSNNHPSRATAAAAANVPRRKAKEAPVLAIGDDDEADDVPRVAVVARAGQKRPHAKSTKPPPPLLESPVAKAYAKVVELFGCPGAAPVQLSVANPLGGRKIYLDQIVLRVTVGVIIKTMDVVLKKSDTQLAIIKKVVLAYPGLSSLTKDLEPADFNELCRLLLGDSARGFGIVPRGIFKHFVSQHRDQAVVANKKSLVRLVAIGACAWLKDVVPRLPIEENGSVSLDGLLNAKIPDLLAAASTGLPKKSSKSSAITITKEMRVLLVLRHAFILILQLRKKAMEDLTSVVDASTIETPPAQRLTHLGVLFGHPWEGAFPRELALTADTARMGQVYSSVPCKRFLKDNSAEAVNESTHAVVEAVAAFGLLAVVSGGCVSTGGVSMTANECSPVDKLVERINKQEELGERAISIAPSLSKLLAFAAHFGSSARKFVERTGRLPHLGDVRDGDDAMAATVAASVAGAFLVEADAAAGDLPVVVENLSAESPLWDDPRLRFSPLLPFGNYEAGLQYSLLAVFWRRVQDKIYIEANAKDQLGGLIPVIRPRAASGRAIAAQIDESLIDASLADLELMLGPGTP